MDTLITDKPFSKISLDFPYFTDLRQEVLKLDNNEIWTDHVHSQVYRGDWQVLPLRGLASHRDAHRILQSFQINDKDATQYVNYPLMQHIPSALHLLERLQCNVLSVRLMKLFPGAIIDTHRDPGLCISKGQARLHFCISSNNKVIFTVAKQRLFIEEGELWYLNADEPHSVVNKSDHSRIHIVMDCVSNQWLSERLDLPA